MRILILEDSASDAALVVEELRGAGYEPQWTRVQSEEDFRAQIGKGPDLIIADYTLPQFDAASALEILQSENLSIPFIIVTGTITEETAVSVLKLGADDFLLKDRLARLGPAVTGALQQRRLREEQRRARDLLIESEERYRRLIARMSALVIELTPQGMTLYMNEPVTAVTGFSPGELLGRDAMNLFFPEETALHPGADVLLQGEDLRNHVTRCRTKGGSYVSLEWNTANEYGADGRLQKIIALGMDITERERAATRIRKLSQLYAAISRTNEALLHSQTPDDVFAAVCRACVEHGSFTLASVGLVDRELQRIIVAHAFGPAMAYIEGLVIDTGTGRGPAATAYRERRVYLCNDLAADPATETWRERAGGYGITALISLPIFQDGEAIGVLTVYSTEKNVFDDEAVGLLEKMAGNISFAMDKFEQEIRRKSLEQQRIADAQRLADLSRRVVTVQEEERKRLAAELHDNTSPNLAAVTLNLGTIAEDLPSVAPGVLASQLSESRVLLEETVAAIRDVCADLRPATLDYVGFSPALHEYARRFTRRTGIAVQVSASAEKRLPVDQETTLFRIAQEALTNCAKHAKASAIEIELKDVGGKTVLTIVDDGTGFDPGALGQSERRPGLGLLTMRERAEFAGGTLSLESQPGKGTRIRVEI